jgi:hypothetical protein
MMLHLYTKLKVDIDFQEFYDRFRNNPSENTYHTVKDGLLMLQNEMAVLYVGFAELKGFFKANPFWNQNLKLFGKEKPTLYSNILPKGSPLTPFFQQAMAKLVENGMREHTTTKWEGQDINTESATETMVLTTGQLVLVFIIMSAAFGFVAIIFCFELIRKRISNHEKPLNKMF